MSGSQNHRNRHRFGRGMPKFGIMENRSDRRKSTFYPSKVLENDLELYMQYVRIAKSQKSSPIRPWDAESWDNGKPIGSPKIDFSWLKLI